MALRILIVAFRFLAPSRVLVFFFFFHDSGQWRWPGPFKGKGMGSFYHDRSNVFFFLLKLGQRFGIEALEPVGREP